MTFTGCSTTRALLLLCFLAALPSKAVQPGEALTANFAEGAICGDSVRAQVLKRKILETIRTEVLRRTSPETVTIEESDLLIQACPPLEISDSDFLIKHAEYDVIHDVTIFWLASSKAGSAPPLMVTVHTRRSVKRLVARRDLHNGQAVSVDDLAEVAQSSGDLLSPTAGLGMATLSRGRTEAPPKAEKNIRDSAWLVKVGMPSELRISGKNFRGTMTVIPLESGAQGQELRVREPGTQRIFRARVTSANQLDQIF